MRCTDTNTENLSYGSTKHQCATCSHDVWASPKSLDAVKIHEKHSIMCIQCTLARHEAGDKPLTVVVTPAQLDEIRVHGRQN